MCHREKRMVAVAQLAEHRLVAPDAAGSIPVSHPLLNLRSFLAISPKRFLGCPFGGVAQLAEQWTLNP